MNNRVYLLQYLTSPAHIQVLEGVSRIKTSSEYKEDAYQK